jgi:hypothetical protein
MFSYAKIDKPPKKPLLNNFIEIIFLSPFDIYNFSFTLSLTMQLKLQYPLTALHVSLYLSILDTYRFITNSPLMP